MTTTNAELIAEWREVPGFSRYEVSPEGHIRQKDSGKPVKGTRNRRYIAVTLRTDEGKWRSMSGHRVVMLTFVGPRPEGLVTRHLDGDGTNNRLSNLAYGTPSENTQDILRMGRHQQVLKTHCPSGHPYEGDNVYRTPQGARRCVACDRASSRKQYVKRAAAGIVYSEAGQRFKCEHCGREVSRSTLKAHRTAALTAALTEGERR